MTLNSIRSLKSNFHNDTISKTNLDCSYPLTETEWRYMCQWTNHHWFRWGLLAWLVPSRYLYQCWNIVNWILRNTLQWNFNQNIFCFIQENTFESIVCEMAAILSRGNWVKLMTLCTYGTCSQLNWWPCVHMGPAVSHYCACRCPTNAIHK